MDAFDVDIATQISEFVYRIARLKHLDVYSLWGLACR